MELFSVRHLLWLGVSALFVGGCVNMRRLPEASRGHAVFRIALFVLILVNELAYPHLLFLVLISIIFLAAFGLIHLPFVRWRSES